MGEQGLRVLLVDDDHAFGVAMAKALRRRGFEVQVVTGGHAAVEVLNRLPGPQSPQVAVIDLRMPDLDGIDVLRQVRTCRIPMIVLTGHGSLPDAVEAMRLGAFSFLTKPVDAADLAPVLRQAVRPSVDAAQLIGDSSATMALRALLARLADAEEPVLLMGEIGTGKEVAALLLHTRSKRASAPFVTVTLACLPPVGIEQALFGDIEGGLFEKAEEGTLFLDEVSALPLSAQAKLLRVLESRRYRGVGDGPERVFKGRLVVATHQDLREEVAAGRFREDLFYRLQVLPLELPPLHKRPADILPIVRHWCTRVTPNELHLTSEAQALLLKHTWPGNVREVVNLVRRVVLFVDGDTINAALIGRMLAANPFFTDDRKGSVDPTNCVEEISLEAVERRHIMQLLGHHRNITKVARILEISRRTLQRKLKLWGEKCNDEGFES